MKRLANVLCILTTTIAFSCGPLAGVDNDDDEPSFSNSCLSNPVSAIAESQTDANVGQSNGSVTILASGGSGIYMYALNGGAFQSSRVFKGLSAGEHTMQIVDDNDCQANTRFLIFESEGNPPSFVSDIQPIFRARCATAGCHVVGGDAPFPLFSYQEIQAKVARIKVSTVAKTMPPIDSPQLTAEEINLIVDWIDAGARDN